MHRVIVQNTISQQMVPSSMFLKNWAKAVLQNETTPFELTLRIVEANEMTDLNSRYRQKQGATNVLSFPYGEDPEENTKRTYLGDIVICAEVVNREAAEQKKSHDAHWAHIVIHGSLHLLGYDHIQDTDAEKMEEKEVQILKTLGFANPYIGE
jgi:probable rRNA maturation factor